VLSVVDVDPQARARTASALTRRFRPDNDVQSTASASAGLAAWSGWPGAGTPVALVALVAANLHLPGVSGSTSWSGRSSGTGM
jgi:uncharacterized protein YbjT (DUF2867 family)